jgi:hypothetical protein
VVRAGSPYVEVAMSGDSQRWYVKVQDGSVYPATLEQIDDAFNAGHIDENTLVLPAGETKWKRLGELAGLDAPESEVPASVGGVATSIAPPAAVQPSSLRPLSVDLDDSDVAAMRPKSRGGRLFGVLVAGLAIGGAVFVVHREGGLSALRNALHPSSVAAAAAPASPPPPPVVAAANDPVVTPPTPSADPTAPRFSDEQKQKLLAADKAREDATKAKRELRAAGAIRHVSRSYKSQGFTTKGSKFDPLNNSL